MTRIIGIDLGTTNSCVAILDDKGQAKILAAGDGERTIPSTVSWSTNGQVSVGNGGVFRARDWWFSLN